MPFGLLYNLFIIIYLYNFFLGGGEGEGFFFLTLESVGFYYSLFIIDFFFTDLLGNMFRIRVPIGGRQRRIKSMFETVLIDLILIE